MPRQPRVFLPDMPCHVIQRGNNRQACFFDDSDYEFYLECLQDASEKHGCLIHAYVLMTNHVHLVVTPGERDSLPSMMQSLGRRYVKWINKIYRRTGTLWEGRYKSSLIESDKYFLTCCRYVELNPVRAGMVDKPVDYPWSSFRQNAGFNDDVWLDRHDLYLGLGETATDRELAYQKIFNLELSRVTSDWITVKTIKDRPIGSDKFKEEIEEKLQVRFNHECLGRPCKDTNNGL